MNLNSWLDSELNLLHEKNLFRFTPVRTEMPQLQFCSNDYLGLRTHPALKQAALQAIEAFGTGSGASRLISGTFPIHVQLENDLAAWFGKETAVLFNSGYHAGIGVLPAIAHEGIIFSDELNHASLIDGCRLSHAEVRVYRQGNLEHLESLLKTHGERFPRWIVSESVYGMEGTQADLRGLVQLKKKYDAALFLDEAHGIGVYGKRGRGWAEELDLLSEIDLILGTFSKACGSFGGFVVGSEKLITYIRNVARSFIFTTALPPAIAAVNRQAVVLIQGMQAERKNLRGSAREVRSSLRELGLAVRGDNSPIIPVILGPAERALAFSEMLLREGIWIQPIRPPTVPPETSRLRITLSASHTKEDYKKLLRTFRKVSRTPYGSIHMNGLSVQGQSPTNEKTR